MPVANKTILLVDDDPIATNIASRSLKSRIPNLTIHAASDGIAAYQYIQGTGAYSDGAAFPRPNLILLDINMPRFTGLEFLQWLREKAPEESRKIPVLVLSSSSSTAEIECARALGATCFPKPVRWPDVLQTIEAAGLFT